MARRTRFHRNSAIYHIMLRGNDGQPIFFSNEDRCRMCLLMQEGTERFGHSILSFCFMSNHIHLAIQVGDISISRIMQNLSFRYTRYFNRKHKRIGHLFQGRFKSVIVEEECYLKELIRYIHLNPVRAYLVDLPEKYFWSSHRTYLMLDEYSWLTFDKVLKNFGVNRNEAVCTYERFILKGMGIQSEIDFKSGLSEGILGDENFVVEFMESVERPKKQDISLFELVELLCKRFNISSTAVCAPGKQRLESHIRSILALFVIEIDGLSNAELSVFLGRDSSTLSKLASRLERKCLESPSLETEINELRGWIFFDRILQMPQCQT